MKGPHIKIPPNLRTRFATLVVPFVSGLPKTFHTLVGRYLSDICYRCQALPSSCRQDHLLGTHDVARGGTIDSVFGRTQAIKHYSNALAQDPLKLANVSWQGTGLSLPGT